MSQLELFPPRFSPRRTPTVIGFCGAKFHGKDTAAKVLIDEYGFVPVSFADGLRKTVATALRVNPSWFLDPEKKEEIDPRTGKSRRYWLQWIGTEGFRALWPDVWVTWWENEILDRGYSRVVTTDMRFPNEIAALYEFFPITATSVRITDPRKPVGDDLHASESHYKNFEVNYDVLNDSDVPRLHQKIRRIAEELHLNKVPRPVQERI
jgi:hypothetical protein